MTQGRKIDTKKFIESYMRSDFDRQVAEELGITANAVSQKARQLRLKAVNLPPRYPRLEVDELNEAIAEIERLQSDNRTLEEAQGLSDSMFSKDELNVNKTTASVDLDVLKVNRFEVIDEAGRAYFRGDVAVELSLQDDGRTLKVFVERVE